MLIAEGELGGYLPISPVATIAEGREMAEQDLEFRMRQLENGQQPSARRFIGSGREVDSRVPDLRRSGRHREFRDMSLLAFTIAVFCYA